MKGTVSEYGERLKAVRKAFNLTQKEFSEKIGIANTTLRRYESNERQPNILTIDKMAKSLNISVDFLLFGNLDELKNKSPEELKFVSNEPIQEQLSYMEKIFSSNLNDLCDVEEQEEYQDVEELLSTINSEFEKMENYQKILQEMIDNLQELSSQTSKLNIRIQDLIRLYPLYEKHINLLQKLNRNDVELENDCSQDN